MKNIKAIALTSLALLPAGVLAACGSGTTTGTASSSSSAAQGTTPAGAQAGGGPPGMGTEVTGTAATKAGKAATAKYAGTVERVSKLDDGSYVVHVMTDSGEQHVLVSAAYAVTGLQQMPAGGPPSGGQPPAGATAPTTPPDTSTSSSATAS